MKEQGSKKKAVKILSLLLAVSFFLGTQRFTVFAETISGNEGTKGWEQGNISEVDYNEVEEGNSQPVGADGSVKEDDSKEDNIRQPQDEDSTEEKIISSGVSENDVWEGEGSPANPIHHCTKKEDGTDYTDWSYVYFGSYPQSEVTDSVTIGAIDKAIDKYGITADAGMDVWVNGIKYRRISKGDTNYDGNFGNSTYRYFKWERIKWRVLKNDGDTLFVVVDRAIDANEYNAKENISWENNSWENISWEKCTIRNWLNNSFYNTAFNSNEQEAIVTQNVVNTEIGHSVRGGISTKDKVYLLAIDEVRNEEYGFCGGTNDSVSRKMKASDYAHIRGAWRRAGSKEKDVCNWWLRSLPYYQREDAIVVDSGFVYFSIPVYDVYCGICPALHINLPSSSSWSMEDDGSSGEGSVVEKTARPEASIPAGSSVSKNTKLSLSCTTVGADIYYTTDGATPTIESSLYTGEITLERDMTVKAVAMCRGYQESDVAEFSYKVQESSIKVQKLAIKAPSKKLATGKKVKLTLEVTPENASNKAVTWKTSNKKYATVDNNGKITLKKAGAGKTVTITTEAKDGSGKKTTIKIKIMKHAVKSIKLKAPAKTLKAGKSMSIKATVKTTGKSVNKTLKWQSSNTKYATVNKKGKVTAKKAGKGKTVTITAASTDGSNKKAKVKIKIK